MHFLDGKSLQVCIALHCEYQLKNLTNWWWDEWLIEFTQGECFWSQLVEV